MREKKASEGENIIENRDTGHLAGSVVQRGALDLRWCRDNLKNKILKKKWCYTQRINHGTLHQNLMM